MPGGTLQLPVTFGEIDLDSGNRSLLSVGNPDSLPVPRTFPEDSIVYSPYRDFSCYISILNGTHFPMNLTGRKESYGSCVVFPSEYLIPLHRSRIWVQDSPGVFGAEGSATYSNAGSSKSITFSYGCPFTMNNYCSPVPFSNKSDSGSWETNKVVKRGHPYFVNFTAEK